MSTSPMSLRRCVERFEIEVDTTRANEYWSVEVEQNLKAQDVSERRTGRATLTDMARSDDQPAVPDVDRLARSMLLLHGDHHDHDERDASGGSRGSESWSKSRDFANDPQRAAAVAEASRADRERYLTVGPATGGLPVLPRRGHRQAGGSGTHCGAMECRRPRSAVRTSPKCGSPVETPRAPSRARASATASSTPSPRGTWTASRTADDSPHSPANRSLTDSTVSP
jgi:hypothetical protein